MLKITKYILPLFLLISVFQNSFAQIPSTVGIVDADTSGKPRTGMGKFSFLGNDIFFRKATGNKVQVGLKSDIDTKLTTVASIASLQAFTGTVANFDGSVWNKKSGNVTSNGGSFAGTLIRVSSSVYWERNYTEVYVEWFGGVGNNSTDNSAIINGMITNLPNGTKILLKKGIYRVSAPINFTKNIILEGTGQYNNSVALGNQNELTCISYSGSSTVENLLNLTGSVNGIQIRNLLLRANSKVNHILDLDRTKYSDFENLSFENPLLSAIRLKAKTNDNIKADNTMWNNFKNISANVTINTSAVGIILDGYDGTQYSTLPHQDGNACHNSFYNIRIQHYNYAIKALDSDNNTFYSLYTWHGSNTNPDILFTENSTIVGVANKPAPDVGKARSNYLFHSQGNIAADNGMVNYVYGYDKLNGQIDPVLTNGSTIERAITDRIFGDNQTFSNNIIFSKDIGVNSMFLGKGANSIANNLKIGATENLSSASLSGNYNIAIGGIDALTNNTTATFNIGIGASALKNTTTGGSNVGVGGSALRANTIGYNNVGVGGSAMHENTTGNNNVALGFEAGRYISNGSTAATIQNNSIIIGTNSKFLADNQTNQIVIGYNTTGRGSNSTTIGNSSTVDVNIFGGLRSFNNTVAVGGISNLSSGSLSGLYNIGIGSVDVLVNNTTGDNNIGIGASTLKFTTTGVWNVAIGTNSLRTNVIGNYNTAVGGSSQYSNLGYFNTSLGFSSLETKTDGNYNTAIGTYAGKFIADGTTSSLIQNNSTLIGANSKFLGQSQTNQIVIGYNAIGNGNNTTVIGNTSTTQTQLFGTLVLSQTAQPTVSTKAVLDIQSTTQGVLIPRMTTAQINAISSPANGLMVYNTDLLQPCFFDGTAWRKISHSAM